jgi:hypothetical protein
MATPAMAALLPAAACLDRGADAGDRSRCNFDLNLTTEESIMPRLLCLLSFLLVSLTWLGAFRAPLARAEEHRVFELRTYIAHEGKMADLHKRFREHTNKLFEKHGMTTIGYWTPTNAPDADNTLVYLLAFPSREARDKSWATFIGDPEWQAVFKASHANGPLVKKVISQILAPTDYSQLK